MDPYCTGLPWDYPGLSFVSVCEDGWVDARAPRANPWNEKKNVAGFLRYPEEARRMHKRPFSIKHTIWITLT